ncbi:hypothetical protein C8R43DRAFT_995920 [Mycena crocata]|nr:hypothetical protein C8R43DRAFT_995920 [Mycena crocata]
MAMARRPGRSFQYIHDLVDGMIALMNSDESRPVNIGNGDEFIIGELTELVRETVENIQGEDGVKRSRRVEIVYASMPTDDPQKRRPDTTRAQESLVWQTRWILRMGLEEMVRYYIRLLTFRLARCQALYNTTTARQNATTRPNNATTAKLRNVGPKKPQRRPNLMLP